MPTPDAICAHCGHPQSNHFVRRGHCNCWSSGGPCLCSQYIRLRWDRWQPGKVGTQPAIVRFRRHNSPTRWSVWLNKPVEFQIKGDPTIHRGIVDKVVPIPFVSLL